MHSHVLVLNENPGKLRARTASTNKVLPKRLRRTDAEPKAVAVARRTARVIIVIIREREIWR